MSRDIENYIKSIIELLKQLWSCQPAVLVLNSVNLRDKSGGDKSVRSRSIIILITSQASVYFNL